jgi:hypothetical protein
VQLELGLRLPDAPASPRLLPVDKSFGSEAATHKVVLAAQESVDAEVLEWLRAAYAAVA